LDGYALIINDTEELRDILAAHYPGCQITGVAAPSGQRVVYFGTFSDFERQEVDDIRSYRWSAWGEVAIKVSSASSPASIARIQCEIDVLNSIESKYYPTLYHNEILTFHPATETPLTPKLFVTVEEKVESIPMSECMAQYADEQAVLALLIELIQALKILWDHEKRYVHRDIKPENILIKNNGDIVVIDLGIIRETGSIGITATALEWGPCTPTYASPEQLCNDKRNINYKSDLFSLGVLAYSLLAGQNPFFEEGNGIEDIIKNVTTLEPPSLCELGFCSEGLSNVIQKLMSKQPFKRYRKIESLLFELNGLSRT